MISVSLYGCSENVEQSLAQAFRNRGQGEFAIVTAEKAQLALIDYEGLGTPSKFAELEKRLRIPFVVLANESFKHSGYHLAKPMRYSALTEALHNAYSGQTSSRAKFDPAKSEELNDTAAQALLSEPETIDLNNFLIGYLMTAIQSCRSQGKRGFQLNLTKGRWLQVDLKLGGVFANVERKILDHLAVVNISQLSLQITDPIDSFDPQHTVFSAELDAFLYRYAQLVSRRKIVHGFKLEAHYKLRAYPNFVSQIRDDKQLALMSYWVESPSTLREVSERFAIGIEALLPLFNACVACGVVERSTAGKAAAKPEKSGGVRDVLRMILARISKAA